MSEAELMQQAQEDGVKTNEEYIVWLAAYKRGIDKGAEMYRPILSDTVVEKIPDYMNDAIASMIDEYPTHSKE